MKNFTGNILFAIFLIVALWMGLLLGNPLIPIGYVATVVVARKRNNGGS